MKNARKLLAAVLAFVMIFALAATAFADGEGDDTTKFTISVAQGDTHTYEIYQIFTGEFYNGALSNIQWGTAGTGTDSVDEDTLGKLTALNGYKAETTEKYSDTEKLEFIETLLKKNAPTTDIIGGSGESAKKSTQVPAGYYIIKDSGALTDKKDTYTLYITEVIKDVTIARKAKPVTMEKTVKDGEQYADKSTANIGDTVSFKLTSTLPENYAEYKDYYMSFKDTLDAGLQLKASTITVTVGQTDITEESYIYGNQSNFAVVIYDMKAACDTAKTGDTVVVSYDAVLTNAATVGTDGNKNSATLTFSNNPNVETDGKTQPGDVPGKPDGDEPDNEEIPDDPDVTGETANGETKTYTFGLKISKTDEAKNPLAGAEFELTSEGTMNVVLTSGIEYREAKEEETPKYWLLKDGTYTEIAPTEATLNLYKEVESKDTSAKYVKVEYSRTELKQDATTTTAAPIKGFVDANGVLKFEGLKAGTYTLQEITAPQGYNKLGSGIEIVIKWVDDETTEGHFEATSEYLKTTDNEAGELTYADGLFAITVENTAGVVLPTTGGIGTTIFYVVGAIMVLSAGVLLITKKRMGM